jgi:preprotein translocase SecE subunit
MAEKVEKKVEKKEKKNFLSLVLREYRFEGLILLVLSLISIILGVMILIGVKTSGSDGLIVNQDYWFIGEYPKAFAWILIILGAVSFVLAVWPYVKPSIGEVKRVSWPTKKVMLENTAITFVFILVIAGLFLGYDAILNQVVKLFKWLADLMK